MLRNIVLFLRAIRDWLDVIVDGFLSMEFSIISLTLIVYSSSDRRSHFFDVIQRKIS